MARLALRGLPGALALAMITGCGAGPAPVADPTPPGREGSEPDPQWVLQRLDGSTFTLGDLRGQPVFVNLWATWCPPCVEELGNIGRLARAVEGTGVHFLLASPEDPETVRAFIRRVDPGLPVVVEETMAPRAFGDLALPTTVILDHRGRIVLLHRGAATWDDPKVVTLLRDLARTGGPP